MFKYFYLVILFWSVIFRKFLKSRKRYEKNGVYCSYGVVFFYVVREKIDINFIYDKYIVT